MLPQSGAVLKHLRGRAPLDGDRPWYEEPLAAGHLVHGENVLMTPLPSTLPPLVHGGVVQLHDGLRFYDSSGTECEREQAAVARHSRRPLHRTTTYDRVYSDGDRGQPDALRYALSRYGVVIEMVRDSSIVIVEQLSYLVDGYVVFETDPATTALFASFYEYAGQLGLGEPRVSPVPTAPASDAKGKPQEALCAPPGVCMDLDTFMFYLRHASTDDLQEGERTRYFDEHRVRALENRVDTFTTDHVEEGASGTRRYFTEERVLSMAGGLALHWLSASEASKHFNPSTLRGELQSLSTDALPEGSGHLYYTEERALSTARRLTSGDIVEGTRLYFTTDRAVAAVLPVVRQMVDQLSLDTIDRGSDPFVDWRTFERELTGLDRRFEGLTTDDIEEASALFFTPSRAVDALRGELSSVRGDLRAYSEQIASTTMQDAMCSLTTALVSEDAERPYYSHQRFLQSLRAITTDDLAAGTMHEYYDAARVRQIAEAEATRATESLRESWDVAERSELRALTTSAIPEGAGGGLYFTSQRVLQTIASALTVDGLPRAVREQLVDVGAFAALWRERLDASTTDMLQEGQERLYHTPERVRAIVTELSVDDLRQGTGTYSDSKALAAVVRDVTLDMLEDGEHRKLFDEQRLAAWLGGRGADELRDGDAHRFWTRERETALWSAVDAHVRSLLPFSTDNVAEGRANLYFTGERARDALAESLEEYATLVDVRTVDADIRRDLSVAAAALREIGEHEVAGARAEQLATAQEASERIDAIGAQLLSIHGAVHSLALDDLRDGWAVDRNAVTEAVHTAASAGELVLHTTQLHESAGALFFTPDRAVAALSGVSVATEARFLSVGAELRRVDDRLYDLQFTSGTLSDDRLKFNEAPIADTEGILVLRQLEPTSYDMVYSLGASPANNASFFDVGFIAQDVYAIPQLAHAVAVGDEATPYSVDYHSITTYAVSAIKGLDARTTDAIAEGQTNLYLTPANFAAFSDPVALSVAGLIPQSTASLPEAAGALYYTDARVDARRDLIPAEASLEQLRYLLTQVTTDDLLEGEANRYDRGGPSSTDVVPEGSTNLYYTQARHDMHFDTKFASAVGGLTTSQIAETVSQKYLTLSNLMEYMRMLNTDYLPGGNHNKYLSRDAFLQLGFDSADIPEGANQYFTTARARSALLSISSDTLTEGSTNRFANVPNVRAAMASLTTADLPDTEGKRYLSRPTLLALGISVGDVVGHSSLARASSLDSAALSLAQTIDALEVDIHASVATTYATKAELAPLSDDRLKFNEAAISGALAVVRQLNPVAYDIVLSLGAHPNTDDSTHDAGFIAQDVLSLSQLAHAVTAGDENTPYRLDYHSLTTYAIAALKELDTRSSHDVSVAYTALRGELSTSAGILSNANAQTAATTLSVSAIATTALSTGQQNALSLHAAILSVATVAATRDAAHTLSLSDAVLALSTTFSTALSASAASTAAVTAAGLFSLGATLRAEQAEDGALVREELSAGMLSIGAAVSSVGAAIFALDDSLVSLCASVESSGTHSLSTATATLAADIEALTTLTEGVRGTVESNALSLQQMVLSVSSTLSIAVDNIFAGLSSAEATSLSTSVASLQAVSSGLSLSLGEIAESLQSVAHEVGVLQATVGSFDAVMQQAHLSLAAEMEAAAATTEANIAATALSVSSGLNTAITANTVRALSCGSRLDGLAASHGGALTTLDARTDALETTTLSLHEAVSASASHIFSIVDAVALSTGAALQVFAEERVRALSTGTESALQSVGGAVHALDLVVQSMGGSLVSTASNITSYIDARVLSLGDEASVALHAASLSVSELAAALDAQLALSLHSAISVADSSIRSDSVATFLSKEEYYSAPNGELSDDRLKFNETPVTQALVAIRQLQPYSYDLVLSLGATPGVDPSVTDTGFLAQDVLSIAALAHAVTVGDEDTPFLLDYHSITTLSIRGIQELDERTTDSVTEGSVNVFHTVARARAAAAQAPTGLQLSVGTTGEVGEVVLLTTPAEGEFVTGTVRVTIALDDVVVASVGGLVLTSESTACTVAGLPMGVLSIGAVLDTPTGTASASASISLGAGTTTIVGTEYIRTSGIVTALSVATTCRGSALLLLARGAASVSKAFYGVGTQEHVLPLDFAFDTATLTLSVSGSSSSTTLSGTPVALVPSSASQRTISVSTDASAGSFVAFDGVQLSAQMSQTLTLNGNAYSGDRFVSNGGLLRATADTLTFVRSPQTLVVTLGGSATYFKGVYI